MATSVNLANQKPFSFAALLPIAIVVSCFADVLKADDTISSVNWRTGVIELRVNGALLPDFQEVLIGPEGQISLPIEAITNFGEGAFLQDENSFNITLANGTDEVIIDTVARIIKIGNLSEAYSEEVTIIGDQLFLNQVVLEKFFKLRISGRVNDGYITVSSDRPLNRDLRIMRENTWTKIGNQTPQINGRVAVPMEFDYAFLSGIQADIIYRNSYEFNSDRSRSFYNINASSEFAFLTHHIFLNGDERRLQNGRWIAGRTDPEGNMFGIGGLHSVAFGDVLGQASPMVGGLGRGVGVRFQAAPVTLTDSFNKTSIDGDAPAGWTAELYVAGQLRDYQRIGDDGRFLFTDIAILYGSNSIKVVLYGPNGLVEERDFSQSVSAGMLPAGKVYGWGTLLKPGKTLLGIDPVAACETDVADYSFRGDWGVTPFLTLSAQGSRQSPCQFLGNGSDSVGSQSYRTVESRFQIKNIAATLGIVSQHPIDGLAVYGSAFIPFANRGVAIAVEKTNNQFISTYTGFGSAALKDRYSISTSLPLGLGIVDAGSAAIFAERLVQKNGFTNDFANIFFSHQLWSLPITHEIALNRTRTDTGPWSDLVGTYRAITSYDQDNYQIRGEYIATIDGGINSSFLNFGGFYRRTERDVYSLGANYDFRGGVGVFGSAQWDIDQKFTLGVSGSYAQGRGELAAQVGFSFGAHRGYGLTVSSRERARLGSVLVRPFLDTNYDGKFSAGEKVVQGLEIGLNGRLMQNGAGPADDQVIWDLDPETGYVFSVGGNQLLDEFQTTPFKNVIVTPRPGRILKLDIPVVDAISLSGKVHFEDRNGDIRPVPLASIKILNAAGELIWVTKTLSDGTFSIEDLLAGTWTIVASTDRLSKSKKEVEVKREISISKDSTSVVGLKIVIPIADWLSEHE